MSDETFSPEFTNPKGPEHDPMREQWDAAYVGALQNLPDRTAFGRWVQELAENPTYSDRHQELTHLYETLKLADHQKRRGEYLPISWPEKFRPLIEQFMLKPGGEEALPSPGSAPSEAPTTEGERQTVEIFAQPEGTESPFEAEVKEQLLGLLGKVESIDGLQVMLEGLAEEARGATEFGAMSEDRRDELLRQIAQAGEQLVFYTSSHPDMTLRAPDGPYSVGDITNILIKNPA